jgi:hypothetical protein
MTLVWRVSQRSTKSCGFSPGTEQRGRISFGLVPTHRSRAPWSDMSHKVAAQGRRKHQKIGGGAPGSMQGHFWILKRAPKKFSRICWRRGEGGRNIFPSYRNCTFFIKFFLKTWKFPNKKGAFDVNLVFTATLACTKRALFITKKGTFGPLKGYFWSYAPVAARSALRKPSIRSSCVLRNPVSLSVATYLLQIKHQCHSVLYIWLSTLRPAHLIFTIWKKMCF